MQLAEASRSVLRVGDGRGFVVAGDGATYVVTASHCLPHLPQCGSYLTDKQTYQALLGPPGAETTPVWADCVFVDPVSDIAILGCPDRVLRYVDDPAVFDQWQAYQDLVDKTVSVSIRPVEPPEPAWLFGADAKHWFRCYVRGRQSLWIVEAAEPICEAMSRSPILGADGKAIGICIGTGSDNLGNRRPNPGLVASIPGWLVDELVMPIGAGPDPVRCC